MSGGFEQIETCETTLNINERKQQFVEVTTIARTAKSCKVSEQIKTERYNLFGNYYAPGDGIIILGIVMESCVAKDLECELEQLSARNVYDYADKLLERLSEEGVITLDELAINDKTFDYVTKKLNQYEIFPKYEIINLFPSPKSDELAVNRRIKGNELFKDEKYFSALCCYNESLCLASPDSETLGLAYANRSAVYFEIGEYTLCLENIQRAKDSKYPSVLISKLDKRERLCRQQIKEKPKSPIALQLMHKANPNYPYIADCLKLKQNSEFGRHIITEKSLKAGEVIAIEEPFIALLNTKSVYKRCTNCLGQFNLNLQPCANCTSGKK